MGVEFKLKGDLLARALRRHYTDIKIVHTQSVLKKNKKICSQTPSVLPSGILQFPEIIRKLGL